MVIIIRSYKIRNKNNIIDIIIYYYIICNLCPLSSCNTASKSLEWDSDTSFSVSSKISE